MTREDAIKRLEMILNANKKLFKSGVKANGEIEKNIDAYKVALSALRPVSREQVEKVWRGEWKESGNCDHKPYRMKNPEKWRKFSCAECGYSSGRSTKDFCPSCGTAKTDKAVDIIMQRLEALKDGKGD